jgi:hypothetical protein
MNRYAALWDNPLVRFLVTAVIAWGLATWLR